MSASIGHITLDQAPTLAHLFDTRCTRSPNGVAYVQHVNGDWRSYDWQETREAVARWQAAMLDDGLQPGDRVAIMCSNRREWVICDQAAQGLGLVTVPVYTNDRPDNIEWILRDCGASLLLLETLEQWQALSRLHATLGGIRRVLCLEAGAAGPPNLASVADWLGQEVPPYRCTPGTPDSLATIIYTSGTTGRPKGVMLSHHNILWNIQAALQVFGVFEHDLMLSFLPLSHAFERTVGYYLPMATGTAVAYNRSIAVLAEDLEQVQPTLMISVPRIFERVHGRIRTRLENGSALRRRLFEAAVDIGWDHFLYRQGRAAWRPALLLRPVFDTLVGRPVRGRLGGRLRFTVCGGAALAPQVARVFIGLGIPVVQGYGLTETAPVIAANPLEDNLPASVGPALPGVALRVGDNGELLTRSPSVMIGYWNNPQATAAVIDSEGWLRTGDQVAIGEHGHVRITGRIKDVIVLSNGEKVPPGDMENAIVLDELVDQVLVIGEGRPYLSALVVPNPEAFDRVARTFRLDPANDASCCDERVRKLFLEHVQQRISAFPGYAQVHRLALIPEPWTVENGLATPTLKLRRAQILERYRDITERLYAGH